MLSLAVLVLLENLSAGQRAALVRACGQAGTVPAGPGRAGDRLLTAGKSNQRIARDPVVALDTGKTHMAHVLGKLGAIYRTMIVACARDLGLIAWRRPSRSGSTFG